MTTKAFLFLLCIYYSFILFIHHSHTNAQDTRHAYIHTSTPPLWPNRHYRNNINRCTPPRQTMAMGCHYVLLLLVAYALVALPHDASGEREGNEHRVLISSKRACDTTDCVKTMDSAQVKRELFDPRRRRRLMATS